MKPQTRCNRWNATYPVGVAVVVQLGEGRGEKTTFTRTPAFLKGGAPVVYVYGILGGCTLAQVRPLISVTKGTKTGWLKKQPKTENRSAA